jgi:hypothetical protein
MGQHIQLYFVYKNLKHGCDWTPQTFFYVFCFYILNTIADP